MITRSCLPLLLVSCVATAHAFVLPQEPTAATHFNPFPVRTFISQIGVSTKAEASVLKTQLRATSSTGDENAVIIDSDFRLAAIFLSGGLLLDQLPFLKWTLGPFITLLGVLFLVQTFRLQFVCDSTGFELLQGETGETGENVVVGGENRWTYKSFVNYEFFPKGWIDQPQGPILVYFKETQTPSEMWSDGPGAMANSDKAIADGATPGQVHFFPALCNCKQLKAEWERNGCAKL